MRLFFALWPPLEVAEQLAGIAHSVVDQFGGKPTRQESIHLTLTFVGELPEAQLPLLAQAARSVLAAPFTLNVDRFGYWPRKQLLWAGETSPCAALGELADALQQALSEAGFAIPGRRPIFSPHITLVRDFPEARESSAPAPMAPINWPCSRFVLIRSQKSDSGSFYQTVADFPLSGSPAT